MCYDLAMKQELLELRKQLLVILELVDEALGTNPDDYLPVNPAPELARTLYAKIRTNSQLAGQPELSDSHIKALLLANGWTAKRTERGTLLSPPPVSDLP